MKPLPSGICQVQAIVPILLCPQKFLACPKFPHKHIAEHNLLDQTHSIKQNGFHMWPFLAFWGPITWHNVQVFLDLHDLTIVQNPDAHSVQNPDAHSVQNPDAYSVQNPDAHSVQNPHAHSVQNPNAYFVHYD